ncbi:MAG: ribonuclease HII [bacterium]
MINKIERFIGIDEVGRGPLAGPITLCAMSFSSRNLEIFNGIKDSKKLTEKSRNEWYGKIHEEKNIGRINFSISSASNFDIDKFGLSKVIKLAIENILKELECDPAGSFILLDGSLYAPSEYKQQETIIKGDEKEQVISTASVVAKVYRDLLMIEYSKKYPQYGFEKHKGYGTKAHYEAIKKYGICEIHRKSFLKDII